MKIVSQNYGKQRVRVLKVLRGDSRHEVKEVEFGVRLEGEFEASYAVADNSKVVPTDTMKNAVHALAHQHLGSQTEPFALLLADHFLAQYPQVNRVTVETKERRWNRLTVDGRPHDHTFSSGQMRPVTQIVWTRGAAAEIESGITELLIMKSTGSGFAGFPKCAWTTLPETEDRVLATSLCALWRWGAAPADFNAANATILEVMLKVFAQNFSASVQATLYELAGAAFAACAEIARIKLTAPNKHYLPARLEPFGLDSTGVSFVPTDEPHGLIEVVIERDQFPP